MRSREWWMVLALIGPLAVLAWLAAIGSPAVFWVVLVFWVAIVVGAIVRVFRGSRGTGGRGGLRSGLGPVADGLELAQDIQLSRPGSPVTYSSDEPDAVLVVDRSEPDPGDLRDVAPPAP